jgi:hypothetical protein
VTQPVCVDAAFDVINAFITALRAAFSPDSPCPPDGGGSTDVRFMAGDAAPTAAWDMYATESGCKQPFLYVRVVSRYRSERFPTPAAAIGCDLPRVVAIEIGVARCAVSDQQPTWEQYRDEAEVSLDDSWRIEKALCHAKELLSRDDHRVGTESVTPYGPEGGILGWSGIAYVQF